MFNQVLKLFVLTLETGMLMVGVTAQCPSLEQVEGCVQPQYWYILVPTMQSVAYMSRKLST
jgi:hypothetical protein